jgi:hypothetical protein
VDRLEAAGAELRPKTERIYLLQPNTEPFFFNSLLTGKFCVSFLFVMFSCNLRSIPTVLHQKDGLPAVLGQRHETTTFFLNSSTSSFFSRLLTVPPQPSNSSCP